MNAHTKKNTTIGRRSAQSLALLLASVLVLSLLGLSLGAPSVALADDGLIEGTEENPAQAGLIKILKLPEGTTAPTFGFHFSVEPKSLDNKTAPLVLDGMPHIADRVVKYAATDTAAAVGGVVSLIKEVNLFDGVSFPHAGVYTYRVTEDPRTYELSPSSKDQMTYSPAVYTVTAYVANRTSPASGTYIKAISTSIATSDTSDQKEGGKIDATPGKSAMTFTNHYVKTGGGSGDPADPSGGTLSISKEVAGDYANKALYFPFEIVLSVPSVLPSSPLYYRAYVVEGNTVVAPTNNADAALIEKDAPSAGKAAPHSFIKVSANGSTNVSLKHGQRLVFVDTPVGTNFSVSETGTADYIPSASLVVNGTALSGLGPSAVGTTLSTGTHLVGEKENSVKFLNTRNSITPTGFLIDNLPYLILSGLALALLGGFVAFKVRRSRRDDE